MLKEPSKNLNRIKRSIWSDIKDTLIEMQNNVQGNNSEWMKRRIKSIIWNIRKKKQPIKTTRRKKEYKKQEDSVSNLWDNFKHSNIHLIGVPEGKEKEQEIGNLKKIVKENFPNLVKEIDMQVQETQRVPNKMGAKRPSQRYI